MRDSVLNSRLDVDIIRHTSRGSCVLQMSKAKTNERFSKHHTRKNIFKVTKALKCFDTGSQLTRTGSFVPCWQSPGFRSYIFQLYQLITTDGPFVLQHFRKKKGTQKKFELEEKPTCCQKKRNREKKIENKDSVCSFSYKQAFIFFFLRERINNPL